MHEITELEKKPRIGFTWLRVLIFSFIYLLATAIFGLIGFIIKMVSDGRLSMSNQNDTALIKQHVEENALEYHMFAMPFIFIGALLTVIFFRKVIDRRSFTSLGFGLKNFLLHGWAGLFAGFIVIALGFISLKALGYIEIDSSELDEVALGGYLLFFFLVSLHEEIVVRGYVLKNLLGSYNKWVALIVSSILFGLMHISNPNMGLLPMINLFLAGLVLGIYYIHRQNLWFPIALHLAWNFAQGPVFGFEVSGIKLQGFITQTLPDKELPYLNLLTGGEFGFEGSILCTIFSVIMIVVLHFTFARSNENSLSH